MVDIPEHLLLRSAEARAKALGITVEQALAEMKGEATPTVVDEEPEVIEVDLPTPVEAEAPAPVEIPKVEATPAKAEAPAPVETHKVEATPAKAEAPAPVKAATPAPPKADTPEEVDFAPEVKVTQRLLTVVKAKPIQKAASEPVDKVNTWPHLMLPEFISLKEIMDFLISRNEPCYALLINSKLRK